MVTLTSIEFRDKVFDYETEKDWKFKGSRPAIIDFFAEWCGPCKRLSPVLQELSTQYQGKVDIYKVDIDAEQDLAGLFGIMSVPTLLFIPMGTEPQMAQGALPKDVLEQAINEVLLKTK
ncbi:MAG: thioredoxin [Pseudomonadota bacterium]|jgi:thioredoxin